MDRFTLKELLENFDKFLKIFHNTSHSPFETADIYRPTQPGELMHSGLELRRRQTLGRPPIYLDPEPGFVAKIVLCPPNNDRFDYNRFDYDRDLRNKTYTYLITSEGGISFKAKFVFYSQPKMKWAKLISKWLDNLPSASYMRHITRFNIYKDDLIETVYSPEWISRLKANIEDRSQIEYLHHF
jgi:hypothetical protein